MLSILDSSFAIAFETGVTKLVAYKFDDWKNVITSVENCLGYWSCDEITNESVFEFFDAIRAIDTIDRVAIYEMNEFGEPGTQWLRDNIDPERSSD